MAITSTSENYFYNMFGPAVDIITDFVTKVKDGIVTIPEFSEDYRFSAKNAVVSTLTRQRDEMIYEARRVELAEHITAAQYYNKKRAEIIETEKDEDVRDDKLSFLDQKTPAMLYVEFSNEKNAEIAKDFEKNMENFAASLNVEGKKDSPAEMGGLFLKKLSDAFSENAASAFSDFEAPNPLLGGLRGSQQFDKNVLCAADILLMAHFTDDEEFYGAWLHSLNEKVSDIPENAV